MAASATLHLLRKLPIYAILCFILFFSCRRGPHIVEHPEFAVFFDSLEVTGSFLLYDAQRRTYHTYDSARCRQGFLPASTFKIPNSLISLETGALRDTGEVIRWDSLERWNSDWNRNHTLRTAFRTSCVPCYQQLAHRVGVARMRKYTSLIDYGQMVIDTNTIATFWLEGASRISPFEQVDFLERFYRGMLPFQAGNQAFVKEIMEIETGPEYTIRAKTGWAVVDRTNMGWWVGWVERGKEVYFFATNIEAPDTRPDFGAKRVTVTRRILERMGLINGEAEATGK